MKTQFSIFDLTDILYEKILYFIIILIIALSASWYIVSSSIPKYSLTHNAFHANYLEQKFLLDLSLLKFYQTSIDNANKILHLDQDINGIKNYLYKKEGPMFEFIQIKQTKNILNDQELNLDSDKFLQYVIQNMVHNYIVGDRVLKNQLVFETENFEDVQLYKEALIKYIVYLHEQVKSNFYNRYFNLNQSSKVNLDNDIKNVNNLINEAEIINEKFILNQNISNDYILYITSLYAIRLKLNSVKEYLISNDVFLNELKINNKFNLIDMSTDVDKIIVRKSEANSLIYYLSSSLISFIIYIISALLLLGYRNR